MSLYPPLFKRIRVSLVIVFTFLLGRKIPLPFLEQLDSNSSFLDVTSLMMGGQTRQLSLFSLGLGPWLYARLLLRLFSLGRVRATSLFYQDSYLDGLTVLLSILQSVLLLSFKSNQTLSNWFELTILIFLLTTGSLVLVWLTRYNSRYGLGQSSLLILAGILSSPVVLYQSIPSLPLGILLLVWLLLASYIGVNLEGTRYKLPLIRLGIYHPNFRRYDLPINLNLGRSMSILYAQLLLFLVQSLQVFLIDRWPNLTKWFWQDMFKLDQLEGIFTYFILIICLTVVFSFLNFDTFVFVNNIKKSGDYLLETRPGKASYQVVNQLVIIVALISGLVLGLVACLPWLIALYQPSFSVYANLPSFVLVIVGMVNMIREEIKVICLPKAYLPTLMEKE